MSDSRSVLVLGGATGVGAAVADRLAREGWAVTVTVHRRVPSAPLDRVRTISCDLNDATSVDALARGFDEAPTAVVHCATTFERRPLARAGRGPDPATGVHIGGFDRLVRRLDATGRRPRHAVLVGSAGATRGAAGLTRYAGHKAAMRGYVAGLAAEWGADGTVNLIEPGPVDTALASDSASSWRRDADRWAHPVRIAPPAAVATVVAFVLGSAAGNLSGAVLPVDGGLMAGASP
ncbi:MAG: SDR family oxidoreductase [Actinomycetota bacterium]